MDVTACNVFEIICPSTSCGDVTIKDGVTICEAWDDVISSRASEDQTCFVEDEDSVCFDMAGDASISKTLDDVISSLF